MHPEFLSRLRCPRTGSALELRAAQYSDGRVQSGTLISEQDGHSYPVRDFIPRFVPPSNYADNFGMQWNLFRCTQLDSHSGVPISAQRFWKATGWTPESLAGQWVLDIGCGSGRFAEIALQAGARVVALDYSSAVDACHASLGHHANLHVVQGDVYALPLLPGSFARVYALGVLQHTPDVHAAFRALTPMVAGGGKLCVDYYWKRLRTLLHMKYVLRPVTRRMSQQRLFALLKSSVPRMLRVSQRLRRVPLLGRGLQRLVPVSDYTGIYPLSEKLLEEWALLDTFDALAPHYDKPQTARTARAWFDEAGFRDVEVFHAGHLVARGNKPA